MNSFGRSLFVSTLFLMAMILVLSARAEAALLETQKAYELQASQIVRWPLGPNTSIEIRPCSGCDVVRLQIDAQTLFTDKLRDGEELSLRDLLQRKSQLRSNDEHIIYIFYRTADLRVSRIVLSMD